MSSVVKKALLSFGVALAVGWAVVWFAMDWRYSTTMANEDAHIATPQSQEAAKPNEYPDTIYQYGHPVGKVVAPEYWTFSRIMADTTFDGSSDFEYHDQRLKILSAESAGRIGSVGQTQQQNFANVRATVVVGPR